MIEEVNEHYMREAKELTNLLFDKDFLNPELTRESIDWLEEYLGFVFQSKCQSAAKIATLTAKLKDKP